MANFFSADTFQNLLTKLDNVKPNPILEQLEKATGQRRAFVILGLSAAVTLVLLLLVGIELIANVFAILPVYHTIKAIKDNSNAKK